MPSRYVISNSRSDPRRGNTVQSFNSFNNVNIMDVPQYDNGVAPQVHQGRNPGLKPGRPHQGYDSNGSGVQNQATSSRIPPSSRARNQIPRKPVAPSVGWENYLDRPLPAVPPKPYVNQSLPVNPASKTATASAARPQGITKKGPATTTVNNKTFTSTGQLQPGQLYPEISAFSDSTSATSSHIFKRKQKSKSTQKKQSALKPHAAQIFDAFEHQYQHQHRPQPQPQPQSHRPNPSIRFETPHPKRIPANNTRPSNPNEDEQSRRRIGAARAIISLDKLGMYRGVGPEETPEWMALTARERGILRRELREEEERACMERERERGRRQGQRQRRGKSEGMGERRDRGRTGCVVM